MRHALLALVVLALPEVSTATVLGLRLDLRTQSRATIVGAQSTEHRGTLLASGDLTGDGIPDLLVGTRGDANQLRIDVVPGPIPDGVRDLASDPGITTLTLPGTSQGSPDAVAAEIADLDADGSPDLVFATPFSGGPAPFSRPSYVRILFGPLAPGTLDLASATDVHIVASHGALSGDHAPTLLGYDLAVADMDQDGFMDLVLPEYLAFGMNSSSGFVSQAGRVHVDYGPFIRAIPVRDLFSPARVQIVGSTADGLLGSSVAVGDLSGDGIPDLAVSAPGEMGRLGEPRAGRIHVFRGPLPPNDWRLLEDEPADTILSGEAAEERIGIALAIADFTGDGLPDLAIGSHETGGGRGRLDVVSGPIPTGTRVLGASSVHSRIVGASALDRLGFDLLAADVDGDGDSDLVAGAFGAILQPSGTSAGVAHVFLTPLSAGPRDLAVDSSDMAVEGWQDGQECGYSRFAADLDADGIVELAVACFRTDDAGRDEAGSVHLVRLDCTGPALTGVPADLTAPCDAVPPPAAPVATGGCGAVTISFAEIREDGACPQEYRLVRTWTATDGAGNVASAAQVVDVVDDAPPVVAADSDVVASVWPPNHRFRCFTLEDLGPFTVTETCGAPPSVRVADCVSDEPEDDRGDGAFSGDCIIHGGGTSFCVRAERSGTRRGRTYSIVVEAVDACGNVSEPALGGIVRVAHDTRTR